jgi:hypothetical protein
MTRKQPFVQARENLIDYYKGRGLSGGEAEVEADKIIMEKIMRGTKAGRGKSDSYFYLAPTFREDAGEYMNARMYRDWRRRHARRADFAPIDVKARLIDELNTVVDRQKALGFSYDVIASWAGLARSGLYHYRRGEVSALEKYRAIIRRVEAESFGES